MSIQLLTPEGAVLGVLAALPLAALAAGARRGQRARGVLGLPGPGPRAAGPIVAVLGCAALLALAATQPIVTEREDLRTRADAEAIVAIDTSRSMLAAAAPHAETRFERARGGAARLAEALPDVPLGLASMTDRVLPHAFPTPRHDTFLATLERVLAVERPPPGASEVQATSLGALADVATGEFFSPGVERRLLFVLTDGESRRFGAAGLERALADADIETILVHVWEPEEHIFNRHGRPELSYVPDASSGQLVAALGSSLGAAFGEQDLDSAVRSARDYLGSGPTENVGVEVGAVHLAPAAVLVALLPLGFLLWSRNAS
ncbi:MAG: VWA domain-containing protein [Solirubrobacterales bacterium]|nr:VWA domain-containing protein [Solirubrobacterales bacterium]